MIKRFRSIAVAVSASIAMCAITLLACSSDNKTPSSSEESVIRRDSAGVSIIETRHSLDAARLPWIIDSVPHVRIGESGSDSLYHFGQITAVVRNDEGNIMVADRRPVQLRMYDSTGKYLNDVGRQGEGPGEFQSIMTFERCGRGLVVMRGWTGLPSWWTPGGQWIGEAKFQIPDTGRVAVTSSLAKAPVVLVPRATPPLYYACAPDGLIAMTSWGDRSKQPGPNSLKPGTATAYATRSKVWLVDTAGTVHLELRDTIIAERIAHRSLSGGGGSGPHPWGRQIGLAQDDSLLYVSYGDRAEISVYDRRGKLVRLQRAATEDLSLTDAMLARYKTEKLAPVDSESRAYFFERYEIAMPPTYPVFDRLFITRSGVIWARRFRIPYESDVRWGVFAPSGAFLGYARLATGLEVFEIGDNYILGVMKDSMDVPAVHMYRIHLSR